MNYSRQREVILESLTENAIHPTAECLYGILKKTEPNLSLATLYRNLNQLAKAGIIKKIDGLEESAHFDHNTHEHYHFICKKCKKVYDISTSSELAPDIISKTEENTEFVVQNFDIIFQGLCRDCK